MRSTSKAIGRFVSIWAALSLVGLWPAMVWGVHVVPDAPETDWWVPDELVDGMVAVDGTLYVGGSFLMIGPHARNVAVFNRTTKAILPGYPDIDGVVRAVAADGAGGWYVGGSFTTVGESARANLAHVLSDGTVDANWQADTNDLVRTLIYLPATNTLYVGGDFNTIGGQARMRLAAVQSDGTVTSWQPGPNWYVYALALSPDGGTLYVGGYFSTIGGQSRTSAAAFDTGTGSITSWNPTIDDYVKSMAVSEDGNTVYVGGRFQMVNTQVRQRLAGLTAADATLTALNANTGGNSPQVWSIVESDGKLYVAGTFGHIGGQARAYIAALDPATGTALAWDPGADAPVEALAVADGVVYAAGSFTTMGGVPRWNVATLDAATGAVGDDDFSADWPVHALQVAGNALCVGGEFFTVGGARRPYLAAIDLATGRPTDWEPNVDAWVSALAASPDGATLFVAGTFNTMLGQERYGMAAIDTASGQLTAWAPVAATEWGLGTPVVQMLVGGGSVYLAGEFVEIDSTARHYLAAVDATTGTLDDWAPEPDGYVNAVAMWNGQLLAGGSFTQIGGQARSRLAAVDTTTGLATSWDPAPSDDVATLAVDGDTLYVGGAFTQLGGQPRAYLGAVDLSTGLATNWDPGADDDVLSLLVTGGRVFAAGEFTQVASTARGHLAVIDADTGALDAWDPTADAYAHRLLCDGERLYVGGAFTQMGATKRPWLAVFAANSLPVAQVTALTVTFNTPASGTLAVTDADGDTLTFAVVAQPTHGTLELNASTGAYTYTPTTGYSGSDAFTYSVIDGWSEPEVLTATVTVNPAPTPDPDPQPDPQPDPEPDPAPTYTLTTAVQPADGGAVAAAPENGPYASGTVVTLTATPAEGYTFVRWDGDASGLSATTTVTLSADTSVTAIFLRSAETNDATVPAGTEAELVVQTQGGTPEARLVVTGSANGGTVRAVINQAEHDPVQSYAGFADGVALNRRLTLASDMTNGTFTAVIEMYYSDDELGSLAESRLRLFHWNEAGAIWEPAGSHDLGDAAPTSTLGDYGVDTANNRVWAVVDHFSEFAAGLAAVEATDPDATPAEEEEEVDALTPESPNVAVCGACGAGAPLAMLLAVGAMACGKWWRQRRAGQDS